MGKIILAISILCLLFSIRILSARDIINEEELFQDPESIFETEKIIDNSPDEEEKKTIGISGTATSVIEYRGTPAWIKWREYQDSNSTDNDLLHIIILIARVV